MEKNIIPTTDHTVVVIKTHGDLILQGGEKKEVVVLGQDRLLNVNQIDNKLQILSLGDCDLIVPVDVIVQIEKVGGDAIIRGLVGSLDVQKIGGDVVMQNTAQTSIDVIGGDCLIQHIQGPLEIGKVGGDVDGQDIQDIIHVDRAGGDVELQAVMAGARIHAGGDINISLDPSSKQDVDLQAGADIQLYLPEKCEAQIDITCHGEDIEIDTEAIKEDIEDWNYFLKLGENGANIRLQAGGDVLVTDRKWNKLNLDNIFEDVNKDWQRGERRRSSRDEKSSDQQNLSDKINQRFTREAIRKAEERIQSALNKIGLKPVEAGTNQFETQNTRNVSKEEKLLVLKMLEEKTITLEQADLLLETLEK